MTQWKPLLSGELREKAEEALAEITESLAAGPAPAVRGDWPPPMIRRSKGSLSDGYLGQALYFGYLHQSGSDRDHADVGMEFLNRAIGVAESEPMAPNLYTGFAGIGWAVSHLEGRLYPPGDEDSCLETDEVIFGCLKQTPCPLHFDLIEGLVGLGVYALERLPRESARSCLEAIVDHLAGSAEMRGDGVTWLTSPQYLDIGQRKEFPQGAYCLGMAHGAPGVAALLARCWTAGVARGKVGPLLEGVVSWVLAQSMPPGSPWRFPAWRRVTMTATPSRLAWCYGDPGVAAALLHAAQAMDRADWRQEALDTARVAARRSVETTWIRDGCLCHGMSAPAHILNRLYQATGEEDLAQAARFWYGKLLEARTPGRGLGGYMFEYRGPESVV